MIFKKQICYDDCINISNNVINAILLFNEDKQAKIGDSFELTYDYKTINAKIVQIKKYKNYLDLPYRNYGLNYHTFNPYFYDNSSLKDGLLASEIEIVSIKKDENLHNIIISDTNSLQNLEETKKAKCVFINNTLINLIECNDIIYLTNMYTSETKKVRVLDIVTYDNLKDITDNIDSKSTYIPRQAFLNENNYKEKEIREYKIKVLLVQLINEVDYE